MIRFQFLCVAVLVLIAPTWALAQEPASNRYTIERFADGFVRLDTETGEMSMCTGTDGQLVCKMAADERHAFKDTLSDLSARVEALENRLDPATPREEGGGFPDDAELDRAIGAMQKMMRQFFGMVEELRRDFEASPTTPSEPVPDRT
ncbi:hypothetical protein SAMN05877838_3034 [Hoeflea halophila]|uniref:Uncharacterized protein n=1 Tax=Hoeflea halophila TaxID=714899 RepID=A0A286IDC8_9HYPH|nr:hypothetical protein [Hoeflea halophila]SOE18120.1 hypothetical protein SAMN05877838_3034 [Hoeflea halophila]